MRTDDPNGRRDVGGEPWTSRFYVREEVPLTQEVLAAMQACQGADRFWSTLARACMDAPSYCADNMCTDSPSEIEPERLEGAPWVLYMYNGEHNNNHMDDLAIGRNSGGLGDISNLPTDGAHKMAEADFDAYGFTELLAVDGKNWEQNPAGTWVKTYKQSGATFTAEEAFATDASRANDDYVTELSGVPDPVPFSNWFSASAYPSSLQSYGPVFFDILQGYGWMWSEGDGNTGRTHGTGEVTHDSRAGDNGNIWLWYGRSS